jgi:transposase
MVHRAPEVIVEVPLKSSAGIEELEPKVALLTRDSSNSSKPPSSDGPSAKPKTRAPMKSKKHRPGGQPDHKEVNRDSIPTKKVNEVTPALPEGCDNCGAALILTGIKTSIHQQHTPSLSS